MIRSLVVLAILFAADAARAAPISAPRMVGSRLECPDQTVSRDFDRAAAEAACFKATNGAVSRAGDVITLRLATGGTKTFEDNIAACAEPTDACRRFTLTHYDAARGFAIFEDEQYESYSQQVIDLRTGETQDIDWYPHFSPSGDRFATIINDLQGESEWEVKVFDVSGPAVRRVYAQKTHAFRKLARSKVKDSVIDFFGWTGDNRMTLRLSDGNDTEYARATLAFAKGQWTFRLAKP